MLSIESFGKIQKGSNKRKIFSSISLPIYKFIQNQAHPVCIIFLNLIFIYITLLDCEIPNYLNFLEHIYNINIFIILGLNIHIVHDQKI